VDRIKVAEDTISKEVLHMPKGKGQKTDQSMQPTETAKEALKIDKTVVKGLDWHGGYIFNAAAVDCKDGKIVRIRPLHYDTAYDPEEYGLWKMEARGKVF
jgi:hypothetical protein